MSDEGYRVISRSRRARTAARDTRRAYLILLDIRLPDLDGLSLLERLRADHSDAAVIIMTADVTSRNAIRATQLGAFHYVSKPINDEHLLVQIRWRSDRKLEREVRSLRSTSENNVGIPGMVGHGLQMQEVYKLIGESRTRRRPP